VPTDTERIARVARLRGIHLDGWLAMASLPGNSVLSEGNFSCPGEFD